MAKRVLLGKEGSNYVLKVSKPGVDVIDDSINDRDYLFNSEMYRAGVIRSNSTYSTMTTSGVELPTTSDSSGNAYIPAFIISEKGAFNPQGTFDEAWGSSGFSGGSRYAVFVNCLNTAAGGGMFQFSLKSSGTTKNVVIPYEADPEFMTDPRPGEGDGTYPFLAARSRLASDGDVKILILGIPCQFGKMINDSALFGTSVLTGSAVSGGGGSSGGGGVVSAPTISSVSRTARDNNNDTVSVNASSGTNNSGTITYAQSTTDTASGATFGTSSSFTQPRNSTRYYFAKQGNLISDTSGGGNTSHIYVSAAVDITPSGFGDLEATAASGSTGTATYTIAGLGTGDTASVSASGNGSASPSSGQNGTIITFSLNATGGGGNITSCNITVGTQTQTFRVTTATDDTPTFNPTNFSIASPSGDINQSVTVTSTNITIGNINVTLAVSTSGCTVQKNSSGSYVSSTTVVSGDTLRIQATSSSTFGDTITPSITIGTGVSAVTKSLSITTRTATTASAPTSMTATQSTNTNISTQTVTCSASGGSGTLQFSNDNSNWGTGTTFSQARNTTVQYYARRTAEAGASSAISITEFVPPLYNIGNFADISNVSAGSTSISNSAPSQLSASLFSFSQSGYGTSSLSASATTNPGSMLSSVAINSSTGAVTANVAANTGSARTAVITVSGTTSQGGTPTSDTFNVTQVAAATNLWEVGITMGGGSTGSGYSGFFAFHGTTTDTSCDLFASTPAWRFYDVPQSNTNTFFWVSGVFSNTGWATLKIYNGTDATGTLLNTIARTSCTHSNPFFTGSTQWELPADVTSTSGNRYLVFS
jgi:hypothetical protein